jgi:hypothetical protein
MFHSHFIYLGPCTIGHDVTADIDYILCIFQEAIPRHDDFLVTWTVTSTLCTYSVSS